MINGSIKKFFTLHSPLSTNHSPLSTYLGIAALLAACVVLAGHHAVYQGSETNAASRYVDPQTCQPCHAEIFQNYQKVAMGRSFYKPTTENVV